MIKIDNLSKKYKKSDFSLEIDSLEIEKNEIIGLVGNNGAGKTTLLRLMTDLLKRDSGEVLINGNDVSSGVEWKKSAGIYIDQDFIIDFLTAEEYFNFIGSINGIDKIKKRDIIEGFDKFFNGEVTGTKKLLRNLSKGNMQKAGIAGAFINDPDFIILDEPYVHLDPTSQLELSSLLKKFVDSGEKTVIISSHDLSHVSDICTRIAIIKGGRIIKVVERSDETLKELKDFFKS